MSRDLEEKNEAPEQVDPSRRKALARLGLTAAALYLAPAMTTLRGASAHSDSPDSPDSPDSSPDSPD